MLRPDEIDYESTIKDLEEQNSLFRKLLEEVYDTQMNMDLWERIGQAIGKRGGD